MSIKEAQKRVERTPDRTGNTWMSEYKRAVMLGAISFGATLLIFVIIKVVIMVIRKGRVK
ncbi:MAG: hypothetical protein ACI4EL_00470 [Candidatus Fimimorpha sp.]